MIDYIRFWLSADSRYSVHSPFVYDFITKILPHRNSPAGEKIENRRKELLSFHEKIEIRDFGAGYSAEEIPVKTKKIVEIVKSSARKRREGELLLRICNYYKPKECLELGTNIGFSALYMLSGLPVGSGFLSVEGSSGLLKIAKENFGLFGFSPELIEGEFASFLNQKVKSKSFHPDLVFLDGHHQYNSTIEYFTTISPTIQDGGIFILDDIRWSPGMHKAWKEIISRKEVSVSLDLFSMGVCFLKRPQEKQHFNLRFRPV